MLLFLLIGICTQHVGQLKLCRLSLSLSPWHGLAIYILITDRSSSSCYIFLSKNIIYMHDGFLSLIMINYFLNCQLSLKHALIKGSLGNILYSLSFLWSIINYHHHWGKTLNTEHLKQFVQVVGSDPL